MRKAGPGTLLDICSDRQRHRFIEDLPGAMAWLEGFRAELQRPLRPAPTLEAEKPKLY